MELKKLFRLLVVGGTLTGLAQSCGGSDGSGGPESSGGGGTKNTGSGIGTQPGDGGTGGGDGEGDTGGGGVHFW